MTRTDSPSRPTRADSQTFGGGESFRPHETSRNLLSSTLDARPSQRSLSDVGTFKPLQEPDKGVLGMKPTKDGSMTTYDPSQRPDRLASVETTANSQFTKVERKYNNNPNGLVSEVSIKDANGREQITATFKDGRKMETDKVNGEITKVKLLDSRGRDITDGAREKPGRRRGERVEADGGDEPKKKSKRGGRRGGRRGRGGHGGDRGGRKHSKPQSNPTGEGTEDNPEGTTVGDNPETGDRTNPGDKPSTGNTELRGKTNAEKAFNFFTDKGLSKAQAAGIVGNLIQENPNFDTNKFGDGGNSRGIAQWNGPRRHALNAWEAKNGTGMKSQLEFMWHELNTTERGALRALQRTQTPGEAARVFSQKYERPGTPVMSNRVRHAVLAFNNFGQNSDVLVASR